MGSKAFGKSMKVAVNTAESVRRFVSYHALTCHAKARSSAMRSWILFFPARYRIPVSAGSIYYEGIWSKGNWQSR